MKINDLENNQVVKYRLGRGGRSRVIWKQWKNGPIYVSKYKDEVITIAPMEEADSAEYDPRRDYCGNSVLNCEDYYMEIEGLE